MGTNYYVRPEGACEKQCSGWVHLGLSSIGWAFTFRAYPEPEWDGPGAVTWPVTDFASWLKLLDLGGIYDEYGQMVRREDLLELIRSKRSGRNDLNRGEHLDADGNRFVRGEFS